MYLFPRIDLRGVTLKNIREWSHKTSKEKTSPVGSYPEQQISTAGKDFWCCELSCLYSKVSVCVTSLAIMLEVEYQLSWYHYSSFALLTETALNH